MRSSRLTVQNSLQAAKNEQKRNIMKRRFPNILPKALSAMDSRQKMIGRNRIIRFSHTLKQTNYHYMKQR